LLQISLIRMGNSLFKVTDQVTVKAADQITNKLADEIVVKLADQVTNKGVELNVDQLKMALADTVKVYMLEKLIPFEIKPGWGFYLTLAGLSLGTAALAWGGTYWFIKTNASTNRYLFPRDLDRYEVSSLYKEMSHTFTIAS
jgi:hypothetical protein